MIETHDLQLMLTIVKARTMRRASEEAHLSQPAISRRIQALEKRMGTPLFERSGRRLQLTQAGEEFLRRAQEILDRVEDLETEMGAFGRGQRGVLRIGATATVCLYLLPPVLREMRRRHPEYELTLSNETSRRMPDLVREGVVDVGIGSAPERLPGLQSLEWRQLHLGLLCQGPAIAAPRSIRTLDAAPLVISSPGSLRSAVDRAFQHYGVAPRIVAQADSLEVIRMLVAAGFGSAVVPLEVMTEDAARVGLQLCPFQEPVEPLPVACFYRRMLPPLEAFLSLLSLNRASRRGAD